MRFFKEHFVFIGLFITCIILRFLPLFDYQFTFDELSGLDRTQFTGFREVIDKGVKIDAHPALVQLLLFYLTQLFGYETWVIKLPFLLMSLGAVLYAYRFGCAFYSKKSGLFAASVFSFSLVYVYYAPIARMYIPGVFFSLGMLYHFFRITELHEQRWRHFFLFGLYCLLSALNQHLNALFAFTIALSGLFLVRKELFRKYLLSCAAAILFYLPHLPVTLYQLSIPGIGRDAGGWLEPPEWTVILDFLKILSGTGAGYIILLIIVALAVFTGKRRIADRNVILMLTLFLLNFFIICLYSVYRSPIYQHSALLFSSTALILAVSSLFRSVNSRIFYPAFIVFSGWMIFQTYYMKDYLGQSVHTVYEYQFQRTAFYQQKFGKGKIQGIFFDCDTLMKKIYFARHSSFPVLTGSDSIFSQSVNKATSAKGEPGSGLRMFGEYVKELQVPYLALSSSTPLYEHVVREHFPYLLENTQTQGVYYKLFSKLPAAEPAEEDQLLEEEKVQGLIASAPVLPAEVDSAAEFPFGLKLTGVRLREGNMVLAAIKIRKHNEAADQLEVCFSLNDTVKNSNIGYSAREAEDFTGGSLYAEHFLGTAFARQPRSALLQCYVWNKAKGRALIESFDVKIIDYWHQKWNYWK